MRLRGPRLGVAAALALLPGLSACGGDEHELAALVPPDAPLYAEFVVQPEGEDADSLAGLAERLGVGSGPGALLAAEIDRALARGSLELSYAEDVEPWLGDRGALFVRSFEPASMSAALPDAAVALEVEDVDAAEATLDQVAEEAPTQSRSHGDQAYRLFGGRLAAAVIDETLLLGTEASFKAAVDSAGGESLADSDDYRARADLLPEGRLVFAYLEPAAVIAAGLASAGKERRATMLGPLLAGPLSAPAALALTTDGGNATLDVVTELSGAEQAPPESPLLEQLPAGSWLAVAAPDLGETIQRTLDGTNNSGVPGDGSIEQALRGRTELDPRADLLDWLSDTAAFVEGGTAGAPLVTGVVAEIDDPEAPRRLFTVARRLAAQELGLRAGGPPEDADYGFTLGRPASSADFEAGVFGYRIAAVVGGAATAAIEPEETLSEVAAYQEAVDALGEDLVPGLYVELQSLRSVAAERGAAPGPDSASEYLGRLQSLVAGSTVDEGLEHSRVTLTLLP